MKTAAIYVRVSTDMQTEMSPDSQRKLALEYCKKNDLEVYGIYSDEGISGRKAEKRPEFQRMISDAKAGAFDYVVVWKFSRFARNMEESLVYKNALKRHGVEVASISEPIPEGPIGALIERIFEWMDEYYSINLSGEVRRGLRERAARGYTVGATPFGYRREGEELVIDPENAEIVREIFRRAANGSSMYAIAEWLNDRGISSARGAWNENTIRGLLKNERYIGKRRPGKDGEYYQAVLPPILTPAEFEAVASVRDGARERYFRNLRPDIERSWVQGVVVCADCGHALGQKNQYYTGKVKRRLACVNKHCPRRSGIITTHIIEDGVLDALRRVLEGTEAPRRAPRIVYSADSEKARARLLMRLERCTAAYRAGVDTLEEYSAAKKEISAALDKLKAEPVAPVPLKPFKDVYDTLSSDTTSTDEKRAAALSVLDRAVFDFGTRSLEIFFK